MTRLIQYSVLCIKDVILNLTSINSLLDRYQKTKKNIISSYVFQKKFQFGMSEWSMHLNSCEIEAILSLRIFKILHARQASNNTFYNLRIFSVSIPLEIESLSFCKIQFLLRIGNSSLLWLSLITLPKFCIKIPISQ